VTIERVCVHPSRPSPSPEDLLDRLVKDWTYRPSGFSLRTRLARIRAVLIGSRPAAPHLVLRPVTPRPRWSFYFVYLPDGRLTPAHEFTLARLSKLDAALLVICAAPSPDDVPPKLFEYADAVCWKGLPGYDFSAYAIGLWEIAERSAGADVLILNDSVYGPFGDLAEWLARAQWDLTGFTASAMIENHVQSYAFQLRAVTPETLLQLRPVFPRDTAFSRPRDVIALQETRMARVASAAGLSVGAFWYAGPAAGDPSLAAAIPLIRSGFPFLKRGLFTKAQGFFSRADLCSLLEEKGHPIPTFRT